MNSTAVSTNNTTTTPLNSGLTWTGNKDIVSQFASTVVYVYSDKECVVKVEYSMDGSNFDLFDEWTVSGSQSCQCEVKGKWARTLVTNTSGEDMTVLRVQTIYKSIPQKISLDSNAMTCTVVQDSLATYRNLNLTNDGQVVKASSGKLYGFSFFNLSGFDLFVKIYNKSSTPTTSYTPVLTFCVRGNGEFSRQFDVPIYFSTGISARACKLVDDENDEPPEDNSCVVNFLYV